MDADNKKSSDETDIDPFSLMDEILDKLRLLDFESQFMRKK